MTAISKPLFSTVLKKPDAILFDWDGTLIDSLPALHSYYNHVLGLYGLPLLTMDEAKKRIRKSAREVFPDIFGDKADEALGHYFAHARETHLSHLRDISGASDFIHALHDLKIPMAVVSNKRDEFLQREVALTPWGDKINISMGAGVAAHDKPAPDSLLLAVQKLGLDSDVHHIWYVGDTETDMQAAVAANCQPVFIEHGLGTREDCVRVGITPYYVAGFTDFLYLLKNMNKIT